MVVFSTLRQLGAISLVLASLVASEANPFFGSELSANAGIEKRQAGTFAITGATNSPTTQPRLEIRQMQQNADQWNLFLLAMRDFKGMNQDPIDSYYSISEIHGVPNVPWDGVEGDPNVIGYCTHLSPLFPAWHRAYMALFEQAFVDHVNIIVSQFQGQDQQRYAAAASTIRMPYWDWAAATPDGSPVLPPSITDLNVNLNSPTGPITDLNPLFRYDMHPLDSAGLIWSPWDQWRVTLRYPTDETPGSRDDNGQAITAVQGDSSQLRTRIYNLLAQCDAYEGFSNADPAQRPPQCTESLEDIHNNIHNDMGGAQQGHQGHMAIIPLASYDPVFWLHHMNVDRIYALWQGVYPTAYTVNGHTAASTYAIPENTQCNGGTFLAPFHSDSTGGGHTSDSVRDTNVFKYTYPEFIAGDTSPAGIRAKVNALYGNGNVPQRSANAGRSRRPSRGGRRGRGPGVKREIGHPYDPYHGLDKRDAQLDHATSVAGSVVSEIGKALPTPIASAASSMVSGVSSALDSLADSIYDLPDNLADQLTPMGRTIDYNAKITVQPYSLGGSATIFVFIGEPASEDVDSWRTDENCVGWVGTFAGPGMKMSHLTQSTVPLTAALLQQQADGIIGGIALNQTLPLLTKQLTWRIQGPDGAIPAGSVPGLTVGVQSAKVAPAKSLTEFPKFEPYTTHQDVTHGKVGGIQQGMSGDWYQQCAESS